MAYSVKNEFEVPKPYIQHFMQNSILEQAIVAEQDYMLQFLR